MFIYTGLIFVFHSKEGLRNTINARLIRYADDFVIMARYAGNRVRDWVTTKIEN
ncbi:MAG: hypothetical protein LBE12_16190 [Planctomycetaceae bacterium]|jgi:hypothetical protein|nr:hypothetical protein [Planctomycetaceae bacterium]